MDFVTSFLALNETPKYFNQLSLIDSTSKQDHIISLTVRSELTQKYPLPPRHTLQFLESVLRTCEAEGIPVSETVYEDISRVLLFIGTSECDSFGMFLLNNGPVRFAAQNNSAFVQNGSTGFVTWEAGKCLAWYMSSHYALDGYRLLELGAGTGMTGIIISKSHDLNVYVFSDYHESTLMQTENNCILNALSTDKYDCRVIDMLSEGSQVIDTDIILGADILYDEDLCRGLVNLLSQETCVFRKALIMSTIRTDTTYKSFKSCLESRKGILKYRVVKSQSFAKWIEDAERTSSYWGNFLKTTRNAFDPVIELVSITKT